MAWQSDVGFLVCSMPIREDQKNEVQQATDLVRLIGEHVALKPKGKEFACLCPFHDDKNPSMFVSPQKQIFKCFVCGTGGDAFSFVMKYHKMTFPEALKHLADRAGITLDRQASTPQQQQAQSQRQQLASANARAVEFFQVILRHPEQGQVARDYLANRGISADMIEAFGLGASPDRWDGLVQTLAHRNEDIGPFQNAGLLKQRQDSSAYDAMRHRLIFPICDPLGRPIAFGGRKLREEDEPKYLNSPETLLFNKSATLYGLNLAKKPIIDAKTAVIVEGYTDVIACHQQGQANVVAALGTALTAEHVRELRRYCEKVVLVMDGDAAGQKAADRAVEVFLTEDMDVAIAVLPEGMDPDSLMKQPDGVDQWRALVASASDALTHQFARVRQQLDQADTVTGRQHAAQAYMDKLSQLGLAKAGSIRRSLVIQRLAGLLHLGEQAVSDLLRDSAPRSARPAASEPFSEDFVTESLAGDENGRKLQALAQAERQLIASLIACNTLFDMTLPDGQHMDEAVTPADFVTPANRDLFARVHGKLCDGATLTLAGLLADLASDQLESLADLATQCDAELEALTDGDAARIPAVLQASAQALRSHHQERQYQQDRQTLNHANPQQLRQLVEQRRNNPSPMRIARFGV